MAFRIIGEASDTASPTEAPSRAESQPAAPSPGFRIIGEAPPPTFLQRLQHVGANVRDVATGGLGRVFETATEPLVALERLRQGEGLQRAMNTPSDLAEARGRAHLQPWEPLAPGARDAAAVIVPQTAGQLGADVALTLIPGGRIAQSVAKMGPLAARIVPAAARVAGATAGGAAGAALGGEDVTAGGTLGGLGALLGEGVTAAGQLAPRVLRRLGEKTGVLGSGERAATQAAKTLGDVTTQMVRGTQASQEAARVGQAMGQVLRQAGVPGLTTRTQDELYALARTGKGKAALDEAFEQAKAAISQRLKGRKLYVPEFGSETVTKPSAILGPGGRPVGTHATQTGLLTLDEALTELQNAGRGISKATALERTTASRQASLRYGEARDALMRAVAAADPAAARMLDRALTGYRMGRSYITLLDKSLDRSGRLDPEKLAANVNKLAEKLKRSYGSRWTQAESALTAGRGVPAPVPPRWTPPAPGPVARPPLLPPDRPGAQRALDLAMQTPTLMLPGLGAAALAGGPLLRHTPGVRALHLDEVLDTMAEGM